MDTQQQIETYITSQPGLKRTDMEELHARILQLLPEGKLWFDDGKTVKVK